jgi:uncharacterized membrane protein YphA (DoxX/SURF4 family)
MKAINRHLPTASRLLLGLIFVVFGLNGFLHFIPPPPSPPGAIAFGTALMQSGYLFPLLKTVEIAAGLLLLAGVLVPLSLTVLAPIVVNIVAFHLFLAPGGMPIAVAVLALELHLAWVHRAAFAPLFQRTVKPARAPAPAPAVQAPRVAA